MRDIVAYCNGLSKAEFWSLGMGDVQNLLDEALEEIERLREGLRQARDCCAAAMNPELAAESDADLEPYHRGWKMGITSVHVGRLPGRLNPCVYVQNGSLIEPLAYFRGHRADEMAYRLIALLDRIAKGIYVGEEPEHIDGEVTP